MVNDEEKKLLSKSKIWIPLIYTRLKFNLAHNAVDYQVNAVENENPHRHGARKPMGDPTIERVNPMFTPVNL